METKTSKLEKLGIEAKDDFNSNELGIFWETKKILPGRFEITDEVVRDGKKSLKITIHPGDLVALGRSGKPTERSEIQEHRLEIPPNTPIWYGFSFYIPTDFVISDNRLVIVQWKQRKMKNKESPMLSFRYQEGNLQFVVRNNEQTTLFKREIEKGKWYNVLVGFQLDSNHKGSCEAMLDGEPLANYSGNIGYNHLPRETFFKMGLYRDAVPYPESIYFSHFRRGSSKEFCQESIEK